MSQRTAAIQPCLEETTHRVLIPNRFIGNLKAIARALAPRNIMRKLANPFIFQPSRDPYISPDELRALQDNEVTIQKANGQTLHGYFFKATPETNTTLVYFHGYRANVTKYVGDCVKIQTHAPEFNILIFDYSGYGKSEGKPSGQTVIDDSKAVHDWLTSDGLSEFGLSQLSSDDLVFLGRSLGGGIVLEAVSEERPVHSVALVSAATSIRDVAKVKHPFTPPFLFPNDLFNSRELIEEVNADRVSIFHGTLDDIVPIAQGEELFDLIPEGKEGDFRRVEGAGHSRIFDGFSSEDFLALKRLALKY